MHTKSVHYLLYFVPVLFLLTVIRYAVDNYSVVPFWDTWALIEMISRIEQGDWISIFEQHNGHRITLTKLLFLADYYVLRSQFSALISANIILMTVAFSLFFWLSIKILSKSDALLIALISCFIFSLCQAENIRWEFESQFFLAQVIPFAAFIFLTRSMNHEKKIISQRFFIISLLFAILANFTLGNGFFASIIIFISLFILNSEKSKKLSAGAVAVLSIYLMISGNKSLEVLEESAEKFNLLESIQYIATYLGSPFFHLSQFYKLSNQTALHSATISGLIFIALLSFYLWIFFNKKITQNKYCIAALCMAIYAIANAGLTAFARAKLGIHLSVSERYTTHVLTGWAAILILYWPLLKEKFYLELKVISIIAILAFIPYQQMVGQQKNNAFFYQVPFSGDMLMTSVFLGVSDSENMKRLFPDPETMQQLLKARQADAGFFTKSHRYLDMQETFVQNYIFTTQSANQCQLHIEMERALDESKYAHLQGWIKYPDYDGLRHFFLIYDEEKQKIGYAVAGQPRPDISRHFRDHENNIGLGAYISRANLIPSALLYFYYPQTGYLCSYMAH